MRVTRLAGRGYRAVFRALFEGQFQRLDTGVKVSAGGRSAYRVLLGSSST